MIYLDISILQDMFINYTHIPAYAQPHLSFDHSVNVGIYCSFFTVISRPSSIFSDPGIPARHCNTCRRNGWTGVEPQIFVPIKY